MLNPLAFLLGVFTPSPSFGELRAAVKPNPYAPSLPTQTRMALPFAVLGAVPGMRNPVATDTGSVQDWADELRTGADVGGRPAQGLGGAVTFVAFVGDLQANARDLLRYYSINRGPFTQARRTWGQSQRSAAPVWAPSAPLNPPGAVTPSARSVAAAPQPPLSQSFGG